jgi:hypothetical protein
VETAHRQCCSTSADSVKCKKAYDPLLLNKIYEKKKRVPLAVSQGMAAVREASPCRMPATARNLVFIFSPSN